MYVGGYSFDVGARAVMNLTCNHIRRITVLQCVTNVPVSRYIPPKIIGI